jgi:VCBS repeat-containing protein
MTTRLGSVTESNQTATTTLSGRLDTGSLAGMTVLGVHFAGRQPGNVGTPFRGIFGTLQVNANGSFSYVLDNTDTDTDLLATGETAIDRFVITYRLGGVERTLAVDVAINGVNEPGQTAVTFNDSVEVAEDTVIARDALVRFTGAEGYREALSFEPEPRWDFTNFGAIALVAANGSNGATTVVATPPLGRTYNYGRITARSSEPETGGAAAVGDFGENHGVASAIFSGGADSQFFPGRAIGWSGVLLNTGLIEAISTFDAYGVWALEGNAFENRGFIYVEGGASYPPGSPLTDPLGIIGFRSGGTGGVINSGTVQVISNTAGVASVGFRFFLNSTNIYNPIYFDNSGTIVADRAIIANGNFQASMYLVNSGRIEGTLELQSGVNQIANTSGGSWAGNFIMGFEPDLVENAGTITGSIDFGNGYDAYRAAGSGTVSGTIAGGAGNDLLEGGSAADRLSGGDGRDWLAGRGGADQLTGGGDADVFFYYAASDSTAAQRDTITDFQSGLDRIDISATGATSFTLTPGGGGTVLRATTPNGTLEVLVNGAVAASDIVTQPATRSVNGADGNDILVATLSGSTLSGGGGNDALHGTSGNDILDGGSGADVMYGGDGDDIFIHDNFNDLIVEGRDGGIDEVRTSIGIILPTFVENGRLLGTADVFLSGNEFDNVLIGNDGNNVLRGNGGNNVIIGGLGVDTLYMNIGNQRAVYNSVQESQRGSADILFFFDNNGDRVDLTAFDVQHCSGSILMTACSAAATATGSTDAAGTTTCAVWAAWTSSPAGSAMMFWMAAAMSIPRSYEACVLPIPSRKPRLAYSRWSAPMAPTR